MFISYAYVAGSTLANVMADLKQIFTDPNLSVSNLSASCDKPNTQLIINNAQTNWVVHDDVPASNYFVLKSLNADGNTYKYIQMLFSTSFYVTMKAFESWNATTHAGSNEASCNAQTGNTMPILYFSPGTLAAGGVMNICVKSDVIALNTALQNFNCFLEIEREIPGQLDSTYPCIITLDHTSTLGGRDAIGSNFIRACRYKNPVAAGDTVSTSVNITNFNMLSLARVWNGTANTNLGFGQGSGAINTDGVARVITTDLYFVGANNTSNAYGPLGKPKDKIKIIPTSTLSTMSIFDETTIDGVTYLLMCKTSNSDNSLILIEKE